MGYIKEFFIKGNLTDLNREQEWNPTFRRNKWGERERENPHHFGTQGHAQPGPASQRLLAEIGSPSI